MNRESSEMKPWSESNWAIEGTAAWHGSLTMIAIINPSQYYRIARYAPAAKSTYKYDKGSSSDVTNQKSSEATPTSPRIFSKKAREYESGSLAFSRLWKMFAPNDETYLWAAAGISYSVAEAEATNFRVIRSRILG